jgi:hypothetical protein
MSRILFNAIRTPDLTILHSKHGHDFIGHKDKTNGLTYYIDGGCDYLKRMCPGEYEELSISDDGNHITRRENLMWCSIFDKNMKRLKAPKWSYIKDMQISHINAIINNGYVNNNEFYLQVFKDELKYRL